MATLNKIDDAIVDNRADKSLPVDKYGRKIYFHIRVTDVVERVYIIDSTNHIVKSALKKF